MTHRAQGRASVKHTRGQSDDCGDLRGPASAPTLIGLASGFEAVTLVRIDNVPTFAATMPDDHITGTQLRASHSRHKHHDNNDAKIKKPHHL